MTRTDKFIIGNWKMNGDYALALQTIAALRAAGPMANVATVICPPFPLLHAFADLLGMSHVWLGAQDCSAAAPGARTGDVSAQMLVEQRCRYVILGHSERRKYHAETDADVAAKITAAQAAGLIPVICVGETLAERESQQAETVVTCQVGAALQHLTGDTIIAYEPVWAIGTGQTPTASDIAGMHDVIRTAAARLGMAKPRILYGGSVKPDNAAGILALPGVDGVLLGGASLAPDQFIAIAKQAQGLA